MEHPVIPFVFKVEQPSRQMIDVSPADVEALAYPQSFSRAEMDIFIREWTTSFPPLTWSQWKIVIPRDEISIIDLNT